MDVFTAGDVAIALAALADDAVDKENDILQYSPNPDHENSDEENDSDCPIFDAFYEQGKSDCIVKMTNFNAKQFLAIWEMFQDNILSTWNVGRGRKSAFTGKDVLFMTLTTLKHAGKWDFLARMFNVKAPTFERMVTGFIHLIWEAFYEKMVIQFANNFTMPVLIANNKTFEHFRFALYATDVTFQHCNRPTGNLQEAKKYYSGKHKLYGYKVEVSVLPNGFAAFCSEHEPGSVSDIDILYKMRDAHKVALAKRQQEQIVADIGQFSGRYPNLWALLCDKGYQGAIEFLRAIHPVKKPRLSHLRSEDERYNKLVASDRIIVENFFGRLCQLWAIMSHKYRWSESLYDPLFKICLSLTNLHIKLYPLRADDLQFHRRVSNRLYSIGEERLSRRRAIQKRYREKRKRRLEVKFRGGDGSSEDEDTIDPTAENSLMADIE